MKPEDKSNALRLKEIIRNSWLLDALVELNRLDDTKFWIGGGAVRNLVWDNIYEVKSMPQINDIDVLHYSPHQSADYDKHMEKELKNKTGASYWSVKNQYLMIQKYKIKNAHSISDAVSHWVETATAVAVRLSEDDELKLICPYGLSDLFNGIVSPTRDDMRKVMNKRIEEKGWLSRWSELHIK